MQSYLCKHIRAYFANFFLTLNCLFALIQNYFKPIVVPIYNQELNEMKNMLRTTGVRSLNRGLRLTYPSNSHSLTKKRIARDVLPPAPPSTINVGVPIGLNYTEIFAVGQGLCMLREMSYGPYFYTYETLKTFLPSGFDFLSCNCVLLCERRF
jgi:hypothetical protein